LFGYWTHCFFSCDVEAYEACIKSGKQLPRPNLDEFFNDITDTHQNQSSQSSHENVNKNKLATNQLMKQLKATEIWRADPRPSYSADVIIKKNPLFQII